MGAGAGAVVAAGCAEAIEGVLKKLVLAEVLEGGNAKSNGERAKMADVSQKKKKLRKNKNRVHVSNTKKPFFFYLNLAKRRIKEYNFVELSALGMAIPTVILISEILKRNGLAIEKKLKTSIVDSKEKENGHLVQKSKIEIVLEMAEELNENVSGEAIAQMKAAKHM